MSASPVQPGYPVRIAAQKSGLTPHVLRAWERRYQVVTPVRSEAGQRLYSDLDVERLRLLHRLTVQGHGIGHLARLPLEALEHIAQEDLVSPEAVQPQPLSTPEAAEYRSAAFRAAQCLDAGELKAVLERAAVSLGVPAFLEQVAGPAIQEIGHGWREGSVSVGQEHLATAVFRRVLGWIIETFEVSRPAARVLVATPAGQAHELGALLAAAAAAIEGWDVIYLGADLPATEILTAAGQARARAVALSIVHPDDGAALLDELKQIRQGLGREGQLFLGGGAVSREPERFRAVGAEIFDSLTEFRARLRMVAPPQ